MYNPAKIRNRKIFGFIILILFIAFIPLFVKSPYYLDLVIVTIINCILAMTFIMLLRAGLISLGLAAFWGIGAYVSMVLVMKFNVPFWISLPASSLITALIAMLLGLLILRNTGFTFLIITSIVGMLFVVLVGNIDYLGGYMGVTDIPPPETIAIPFLPPIVFDSKVEFLYLALILFVVVILITTAFYSAWSGRAWMAIGMSPNLATSIGINVFRYQLLAFSVASGIAGLAGSFWAHYQSLMVPETFDFFVTIYAQIYAILGGMGYVVMGPLVGAAMMTFLPEFLRIADNISPIIVGVLLVILMIYMPQGILGLFDRQPAVKRRFNTLMNAIENILPSINRNSKA